MKKKTEEREIKGEVQSYGKDITPFPGGRGSRGLKMDEQWHNVIGYKEYLEKLTENHPPGSFVKFTEKKNAKGFWDVVENTLKPISKHEAYGQVKIKAEAKENIPPQEVYSIEDIQNPKEEKEEKIPPPQGELLIQIIDNQPRIFLKIPKCSDNAYVGNLMILLTELRFADNLLMKKISECRKSMLVEKGE